MNLPSSYYGEGVETAAIQSGAPLAKTAGVNPTSRSDMGIAPSQVEKITPLYAETTRPDEPITAGSAFGPGPGPEILGSAAQQVKLSDTLAQMLPFDTTGEITILYQEALARGN
jgi:hypothetical protein